MFIDKDGSLVYTLTILFLCALPLPALSFSNQEMADSLRKAKIVNTAYQISVERKPDDMRDVFVTTILNPKALPNDCKIDAVLAAKTLMDADKTILVVHYRLKENMKSAKFDEIVVKESDIKAYGAKAIDQKTLLEQLDVVQGGKEETPQVAVVAPKSPPEASPTGTNRPILKLHGLANSIPKLRLLDETDRKLAVEADIAGAAMDLNRLQTKGFCAPNAEGFFDQAITSLDAGNVDLAEKHATRFFRALKNDNSNLTPLSKDPAPHHDYLQIHRHYYGLIEQALGADAPKPGALMVQRVRAIARIRELEHADQDCTALRRRYAVIEQMAEDKSADDVVNPLANLTTQIEGHQSRASSAHGD